MEVNKNCGIYKITNLVNGKCYIGQSTYIPKRWRNHKAIVFNINDECYDYPLYRAIRKYGLEQFEFKVIENCSKELLNDREKYWISYYDSYFNGYNQDLGGSCSHSTKLVEKQINEIVSYLQNTHISQYEIAQLYNVDQSLISNINCGKCQYNDKLTYPLRKSQRDINFCVDCGKEISKDAIRCYQCSCVKRRTVNRPLRNELKELIRTKSFAEIGRMFNVSDNTIRKWCVAENLPRTKNEIKKYTDTEWNNI